MPLLIVVIGIFVFALAQATKEPIATERSMYLRGEVEATNFLAYRQAVLDYLNANPSASGLIADGSLTWLPGYVRDTRWSNVVAGGQLYVYSTGTLSPTTVQTIYGKSRKYIMVGTKNAAGNLVSASGSVITTTLPGAIASGALVYVGK